MGSDGNLFRDKLAEYIKSWDLDDLEVCKETHVGMRFITTPRKLDIIVRSKSTGRIMGIECKLQRSDGSAYEKYSYTLDDCKSSPIPTIIAFAGPAIRSDMKAKLISSGIGIEIGYTLDEENHICAVLDPQNIFRQRVYIELGLNWLPFASSGKIMPADYGNGYNDPAFRPKKNIN